jgi:Tol biopolymer transport system component
MSKQVYLLILFVALCYNVKGQYVDYGEDPARLKWDQIKTEHYKIIYPKGNEERARLYANILETVYPHVRNTMSAKRSSVVPVILHPYNVDANGMVSWAPKRMELLPSPNFDSRFQIPEFSLVTHESRHVVQMEKQNQGIFRPLRFIFGEQVAGISSLFVPQWLLEGEAVVTETALSSSGRGRLASFLTPYRAQIATGKNFSLDKWYLGSYKDYTHDFYALGYAMSSHARLNHGADVWDRVLDDMTRFLFHPIALKKNTGLSPVQLFDSTFAALQEEWDSLTPQNPDKLTFISPQKTKRYTSYKYAQEVEGGVIALKTSLSDISSIVMIDFSGKERRLTYVGSVNSKLTHSDGFVYWTEYVPGIRWEHENYSVVKQLNIKTKKVEIISKKSRYFTPAISSGKIAVFEHQPDGQNNIVLMDLSGKKLKSCPVIRNWPVQDMVADDNGNIFTSLTGRGNAIFKLNLETSRWNGLLSFRRTNIESLGMQGDKLIFESGYNGVGNIYSFDTMRLSVKRLTNSMFGSFSGSFSGDGKKLYLSDYSAKGHRIASIETDQLNEEAVSFKTPYKFEAAEGISAQESFNIDEDMISNINYESKPYKKAANLFNVHSWMPGFVDVDEVMNTNKFDFKDISPGVLLLSQNRLNTLTSQISYYYDINEKANHGFLSLKYSGWFPVFQFKLNVGGQRDYLFRYAYETGYYGDVVGSDFGNQKRVAATFSAYLPLTFTKDHYIHGLQPFINYKYVNSLINDTDRNYQYFYNGIYYYRYRALAHNDIFPKFGWQLWLNYVGHPKISMGELFIAKANVYLPGLFRNHGLRVSASFQDQFISSYEYYFPEQYVDIARGYPFYSLERTGMGAESLYTFKGDYSFPIVYPDIKIGSLMYVSRIRGNLFYDVTINNVDYYDARSNHYKGVLNQPSYGFDLMLDTHFLRIKYAPVTLMFRAVKTKYDNRFSGSFSIGINM